MNFNALSVIIDSRAIGDLSSGSIVISLETGLGEAIPHSETHTKLLG